MTGATWPSIAHYSEGEWLMETVYFLKPKEEDIDELDHVNNGKYVSYLEEARGDWYAQAGISFSEMMKRKLGTVVLKMEILFLKEARLGDSLKIVTRPLKLGNTSFVLKQDIFNQRDEHITEATITSVMFDTQERKSIKVVDEIAEKF